ncbi:hypothetical protein [Kibdelosporangium philippinense]|uniref:hypothetical protein n=1 Tax=Kibdelosporangium philippinense TaxID=211113 RepID=UPI003608E2FE
MSGHEVVRAVLDAELVDETPDVHVNSGGFMNWWRRSRRVPDVFKSGRDSRTRRPGWFGCPSVSSVPLAVD